MSNSQELLNTENGPDSRIQAIEILINEHNVHETWGETMTLPRTPDEIKAWNSLPGIMDKLNETNNEYRVQYDNYLKLTNIDSPVVGNMIDRAPLRYRVARDAILMTLSLIHI